MFKSIKYTNPLVIYGLSILSFTAHGFWCWSALIFTWVLVPLLELLLKPDANNMSAAQEEIAKNNPIYDVVLYFIALLQIPTLIFFLFSMQDLGLSHATIVARILTMGLLCGTFGINLGHELGHRGHKFEQNLAKIALLSSLYMHFFVEHNKGHHKNVATYNDPSSARLNEPVYLFYFRTIINSYRSAWHIANEETLKKGKPKLSLHNEMVQMQLIQLGLVALIYLLFGGLIALYFLAAAFVGILLLETVNYIEHYGLQRKQLASGNYERTLPQHSWNSNHLMGRMLLFELSRHSDHHYLASRKYQILKHHADAPQLPTGYPGSMLLALLPPLWFGVMNKKIAQLGGR